jgi:hypothetical protein
VQNRGPNPLRNKVILDAALDVLVKAGHVRLFKRGKRKLIEVNAAQPVATVATGDPLAKGIR